MEEVLEFLQKADVFYLATAEGDQPRVRPMGFVMKYKGKLYFSTNNTKEMYKQMLANPKVEICAMHSGDQILRLHGKIVYDAEYETKVKALEESELLARIYKADDGRFTLFYLESGKAVISTYRDPNSAKEYKL